MLNILETVQAIGAPSHPAGERFQTPEQVETPLPDGPRSSIIPALGLRLGFKGFGNWNFRTKVRKVELSFPGTFVPRNLRSLEPSFP